MTGMNILCSDNEQFHKKFNNVQKKMLHFKSYKEKTLLKKNNISIGFTGYNDYPMSVKKKGNLTIFIEGMIYNKSEKEVIDFIIKSKYDREKIKEFVSKTDGEYIISIYDSSKNTLVVFNDALGRLPFYYHKDTSIMISREIKFILPFMKNIEFDRDSILETLLYEFPFDKKTLINDVFRMKPATLIKINVENNEFSEDVLLPINFDIGNHKFDSTQTQIEILKKLFIESWKRRIESAGKKKIIVSISGGLDSRATLAGITSFNNNVNGVTWLRPPNTEVEYAKRIAETFDVPLDVISVSDKITIDDYKKIISLKDGMNGTRMSFSLHIYDKLVKKYGQNTFLCTGTYGGELLRDLRLTSGVNSKKKLLKSILNTNDTYKYDNATVCKLLGIKGNHLKKHISDYLDSYNEKDLYRKYSHFKYEREYKWAGEGEDRQRMFLWSTTAFYALPVYRYITYAIEEDKKGIPFFVKFLNAIDPKTCSIDYYNDKTVLTNTSQLKVHDMKESLAKHPTTRYIGKIIMNMSQKLKVSNLSAPTMADDLNVIRKLAINTLKQSEEAKNIFSYNNTLKILENEKSGIKINRILTLLLFIREIENIKLSGLL